MPTPPSLPHLHTLSPRERAVVDLAVEGLTDEQIAQRLDLSVSTVNSYWVRIRGKLGPLSRTEIVGTVLRCELGAQSEDLRADKAALEAELARTRDRLRTREAALATCGGDAWPLLAFENQPVAALVVRDPGLIAYANRAACHLLGWTADALANRPVWELTVGEDQPIWERSVRAFFEEARIGHAHAGIERAQFAKRGDGTLLRITARAESFDAPQGAMAVVTIREYLDELEALVQALRQTAHLA